jgi:hypothetical protein
MVCRLRGRGGGGGGIGGKSNIMEKKRIIIQIMIMKRKGPSNAFNSTKG